MRPLSPALLVVCAQGRLSGRTTFDSTQDRNRGRRSASMPAPDDERAWMQFINAVGFWAHYDQDTGTSSWPIPHLATVAQLARFGLQRRVLFDRPEVGDLVVEWNRMFNRYYRASIVAEVLSETGPVGAELVRCRTLGAHSRGGLARLEKFTPAAGDRFLRWVKLEQLPSDVPWEERSG